MKKKEYIEIIKADLYRYYAETTFKKFLTCFVYSPGFRYTFILRKCQFNKNKKTRILHYKFFKFFLRKYTIKYGYQIFDDVKIGKGFYIGHLGGISINPKVIIGNNVNISKGVTIGETYRGKNKGVPIIGNRVWIGTNAVVVGNVIIGNDVLIAPGSFVNFDVPDNSVVIGNPGKITDSKLGSKDYINHVIDET